ncbi:hypothetical protein LOTGIDRAFT_232909 [Lottia gigantea]|uniref:EF-hand domain-containing protein n=1 Tax=Lottia gigantea TaxID=225164 RepID=V4AHB7_LOTGI|nr:hypothetical protein LOTGIDRAFT_232909 [Lottia gigantea]ESO92786.1 hypothetical protein LOTGIDRAFT_232909 [Lottia gigantea]
MLSYIIALICFTACSANILQPYNETAREMFHANDANQDGIYERAEIDYTFMIYDTNPNDGRVSHAEYTQYINNTSPSLHALSLELYNVYDVDNDNLLEKHDYDNFFKLMDYDDNNEVSEHEFVHYWTIMFESLGHLIDAGGISL